jgi:endo-1,4-beta-xylanase
MTRSRFLALATAALCGSTPPAVAQRQRREVKWNIPDGKKIPGVEHGSFRSPSMGIDVGYNVFLPPAYVRGTTRYPVVYFLHGAGGTENSDAEGIAGLLGRLIEQKKIPPVIGVFPNGGMSGYVDRPDEKVMGETLIVRELVPLIDRTYRTLATREGRVLWGFSMGGGGAVRLAFKHPDLFSAAGSWAGSLGARRGGAFPAELETERIQALSPKVRLLLIVGDQDLTYEGHKPVVKNLEAAKYPFEYRVLKGVAHNLGLYYELTGDDMVRFLTSGF